MDTSKRLLLAPLLVLLFSGCTEPVSPMNATLDFGEHYLPGTYEETTPLSNETQRTLTLESAEFASGVSFDLLNPLPLVMDGGAEYPLDFTFTTAEGLFGEIEDTVTLTVSRAQGEPFTVLFTLSAVFLDGDLDDDGHVDTAHGGDDCQDDQPDIYGGAEEICDGLDNDCDGILGDGTGGTPDENDSDSDGYLGCEDDCDDIQSLVHPGALEGCDGLDSDCDGLLGTDEIDQDGDGYTVCDGDCLEGEASVSPGELEEVCDGYDTDCDGFVPADEEDDADGDGYLACEDCDDDNPDANPGRVSEICDGFDTDCDGLVDGDDPDTDVDLDGFTACGGIDCNDSDALIHPGLPELCDGLDNDCDPSTDENTDNDGDGFSACQDDCNDLDSSVYDGAPELCDLLDNDCDGSLGDGANGTPDETDGDADLVPVCANDCDDGDPANYPGNTEVCDGQDNNCDTEVDEGMLDADSDGVVFCVDCDDNNAQIFPGNEEICDGLDNDCEPATDENVDGDADGSTICAGDCDDSDPTISPLAPENCNGIDDDCDGELTLGEDSDSDGDGTLDCNDADCPEWVDASFNSGPSLGTEAAPWQTITQALSSLDGTSCETAWVEPGTYAQDIAWPASGDDVSIVSTQGSDFTVIQSNSGGTPITIDGGQTIATLIEGFRITGGDASGSGGGILVESSSVTLESCEIDGNMAEEDGGGVAVIDGSLNLYNSSVHDNSAGVHGGGIFLSNGTLTIDSSTLDGNDAAIDGGAVYHEEGGFLLLDSQLTNSDAGDDGGTLFLSPDGSSILIRGNTFDTSDAGDNGGCLYVDGFNGQIYQNVFLGCDAADLGGAMSLSAANGLTLVYNNVVNGSSASMGAGLYTTSPLPQVVNNTFFDNVATDSTYGATLHLGGGSYQNNIVAFGTGYGVRFTSSCCTLFANNDIFGMSWGSYYSNDQTGLNDNISVDPGFTAAVADGNPYNDDLTLGAGSACIDAGNPASVFNDPDGSVNDLGAFGGPDGNW